MAHGNTVKADLHASQVLPAINAIRADGITSLNGIARELAARRIRTARHGKWTAVTVRNLLARKIA